MSDAVIRVENLGKKYIIGHEKQERYTALRDVMANSAKGLVKSLRRGKFREPDPSSEEFWALKDVSFEIKQGDRVGIIGRNGAGKSTLLKILSRITEPTEGRISIRGRVASLLEVGTGFHPELTGRENIFLNGAILGMGREEIRRKFDEIVTFAEVERFLDTPVKRYSSGMYVRLAFAVAAHLEPEILIVDEVLAVGDAEFQKKCLGKMEDVAEKEGRTVLFVSHQMSSIENLCSRAILLESGKIIVNTTSTEAVNLYLSKAHSMDKNQALAERKDRSGSGKLRVSSLTVFNQEGIQENSLKSGKDYYFEIGYSNYMGISIKDTIVSLDISDDRGYKIMLFRSNFTKSLITSKADRGFIYCRVNNLPLAQGLYRVSIFLSDADTETLDYIEDAASINVEGGDFFGTGSPGLPTHCKILAMSTWTDKLSY
jgi:lipopolysaccharide transport system ATP-binding protein